MKIFDVIIIGAGAAGLAAGKVCARASCSTLIIDRAERTGGVLDQCIHTGFGLRCFQEELSGPEFAWRLTSEARDAGVDFALAATVTDIKKLPDGTFIIRTLSGKDGITDYHARAILLAAGCRERTRGAIAVPGGRPSGIFTAGAAQKLLNRNGLLPGKTAVIVGSGDIGLIMARRLRWCGIEVKAVVEIMPYTSGLTRNVVQCLHDFNIPLYLSTSVVQINGRERVESIVAAPLNEHRRPEMEKAFKIDCDTVLLSVGLIPEMELARKLGVKENPATGGAIVDSMYSTSVPGVFSAGNMLHVHDLADFAAEEAEYAAKCIIDYLVGVRSKAEYQVTTGKNLKYAVPNCCSPSAINTIRFLFRPTAVADHAVLRAKINDTVVWEKKLHYVRPAEMISAELKNVIVSGDILFELDEVEK